MPHDSSNCLHCFLVETIELINTDFDGNRAELIKKWYKFISKSRVEFQPDFLARLENLETRITFDATKDVLGDLEIMALEVEFYSREMVDEQDKNDFLAGRHKKWLVGDRKPK